MAEITLKNALRAEAVLDSLESFVVSRLSSNGLEALIEDEDVWNRIARTAGFLKKIGADTRFVRQEIADHLPRDVVIVGDLNGLFQLNLAHLVPDQETERHFQIAEKWRAAKQQGHVSIRAH
ncbi:hypothetical protein MUO32_26220 [Shinella sp. CPCC 101442]|uniref:hypothetical protein n=1 Tax=Shinella sp. CPCC 101442 TaxID=2932265 RepID=UPI0021538A91|nr:hypothetical protein [Shinella sp. CPCC 101442]MCR6502528.1 hypothetical protein [Shinella sp. CPCC 101442]